MPDDLTFLSTRYLLGELSEAESAAFESRLATDQEAREALADSALLLEALSAGDSQPERSEVAGSSRCVMTPDSFARKSRRLSVSLALVTVACLLVVVSLQMRGLMVPRVDSAGFDDHAVVVVWTDLAQADALDETAGEPEFRPELADVSDDGMNESEDVPDWLIAAVLEQDPADLPGPPAVNSSLKEAL